MLHTKQYYVQPTMHWFISNPDAARSRPSLPFIESLVCVYYIIISNKGPDKTVQMRSLIMDSFAWLRYKIAGESIAQN